MRYRPMLELLDELRRQRFSVFVVTGAAGGITSAIVADLARGGVTVFLTTHYMEEAEKLCDDIAILDRGRIIARGAPDELIRTHCKGVTVVLPRDSFQEPPASLPLSITEINGTIHIQTSNIDACLKQLLSHQVDLSNMSVHSPNLEHVFLNLTGRHLRD